jgi:transposase
MTQANIGTNLIIGIDVSKDKLDIMIFPSEEHFIIENTRNKIGQFIRKTLVKATVIQIVMEATGGYERLAFEMFSMAKLTVHIAHPNKVFHYGKSKGSFAKTDKIDAKLLANYGLDNELDPSKFDKNQYYIHSLSMRLIQIKEDLMITRCRLTAPSLNSEAKKSLIRQENWLKKELELIEVKLEVNIVKDELLAKVQQIITSVKGVGKMTANLLICQMSELGSLNKREIASLSGLAPRNNDSGKRSGMRRIIGGKAAVRKALYLCALSASKHNPKLKLFYNKLIEQGKKPKVALIAVARKLIVIINSLVAHKTTWDESYEKNTITA